MEMVSEAEWKDWRRHSGKLCNPGKRFFLELASESVRQFGQQK